MARLSSFSLASLMTGDASVRSSLRVAWVARYPMVPGGASNDDIMMGPMFEAEDMGA